MRLPIIMPQLGESIAEATVIQVSVGEGDQVGADQEIIEVETNKALLQVTTPCAGEVLELIACPQQTYAVGAVLGYVEATAAEMERLGLKPEAGGQNEPFSADAAKPAAATNGHGLGRKASALRTDAELPAGETQAAPARWPAAGAGLPVPAKLGGAGYFSPRLRARLTELGLHDADLAGLAGSGAGGRVTVADVEKLVAALTPAATEPVPAMRLAVGEALRRSISRPLATVGRPVCLDAVLALRGSLPEPKPAFVLYTMRALALALAADPTPARRILGQRFLPAGAIDIGCAVEVDGGLMVPVLRKVDGTTVANLNPRFQELVAAARRRQLPPDATGHGLATVSNFGVFGLTWATPIPLPDESLILGLGAARKVPEWDETKGAFMPVTAAELTLTLDHRVLDGGSAGRLLDQIVRLLQTPENL